MGRKIWNLDIEGNHHIVNLDYNGFTLSGKVVVDGKFIEGWSAALKSKDIKFDIGGKPAILRYIINPLSPNKQELYVDGVLVNQTK